MRHTGIPNRSINGTWIGSDLRKSSFNLQVSKTEKISELQLDEVDNQFYKGFNINATKSAAHSSSPQNIKVILEKGKYKV